MATHANLCRPNNHVRAPRSQHMEPSSKGLGQHITGWPGHLSQVLPWLWDPNMKAKWALAFQLLQVYSESSISHSVVSLRPHRLQSTRLFCPWYSPGKDTGVGCHPLLQGTFPTQGSRLGLLCCRQTLYYLSHQGPKVNPVEK